MTPEILPFGNKIENHGMSYRGNLTALEFNQTIEKINDHTRQLNGLSLQTVEDMDTFNALTDKDNNTLYLVFE